MHRHPTRHLALFAMVLAAACPAAGDESRPAERKADADPVAFLRLVRDDKDRPVSLDTAIVPYEKPAAPGERQPLRVDLVAVVHIGSGDYYDRLDAAFAGYDAVLYELVAPPQARVPQPGKQPAGVLGSTQTGLTRMLGLEFQLDKIDYTAANFVHADLSPREFQAAMQKRGETFWTMFSRMMKVAAEREARGEKPTGGDVGIGDIVGMLFGSGPARQTRLRRMMAEQFTDMEVLTKAFGGEEGSTLITDRNAAAIAVLRKEIARGRRRIAIFYGAAHMDDFDRRLREEFALQPRPRDAVWLEAWGLREPEPAAKKAEPAAARE